MFAQSKLSTRLLTGIACALLLAGGLWPGVRPALAQGEQGDVLFLFDTTDGMQDVLSLFKEDAKEVLDALAAGCDPAFAVAQYRDWPPQGNPPWHLVQDVTPDRAPAVNAIDALYAEGGGDRPDSVGWALHSALGIGWREDSVQVIVLVGSAPPQDPDPGADGAYGTADDLLFADVLSELVVAGAQVIGIYLGSEPDTVAYWNGVTNATTGRDAIHLRFPDQLSSVVLDTVCRTIAEATLAPPPAAGPSGSLRGAVFHDANRNSIWDAGEQALPGIEVTVYSPGWESAGDTGDDGTFGVVALSSSWWGVRVAVPGGWEATTPADRWGYYITEQGTVYFGINFGLAKAEGEMPRDEETRAAETPEEETRDEEKPDEEAPFVLPVTGGAAGAGMAAVGVALAGTGLFVRQKSQRR